MAVRLPPVRAGRTPPGPSKKAVEQINAQLQALGKRYTELAAAGDYAAGLETLAQALRLAPNHPTILGDRALCHLRLKNYALAREGFSAAAAIAPNDPNLWDGLTEACGSLGLKDEVREYGVRALSLKDAQTRDNPAHALPPVLPAFSQDRARNVIAFSLFGSNPKYCETAVLNVQQAQVLLPCWTCRFYVDSSVPVDVVQRLQSAGAVVLQVSEQDQKELNGLMWRFLVMQDPQMDRFLLRDADSLISTREVAAIDAWLQSGKWFHLMRDYFTHTELLLAGMWGGCNGVFTNVRSDMVTYIREGNYLGKRVVDQHFLRAMVWPTVRQSLLSHDSVFGFYGADDFPAHPPHGLGGEFHVGCNLSTGSIGAPSTLPDGQQVAWVLKNGQGETVCSYAGTVKSGKWMADLPWQYLDRLKDGSWRVDVV